ncbi:MAG TPA: acylphosphatase [Candidatus Eisenbacteria bacterium]|nr:acylphosphatase [Candidatus Eisenbacteria bacterium]
MTTVEPNGTDAGGARDPARLVARVEGRVQGVGYRAFVRERAVALGLSGWVRNLPSGDVDLEAEGPRANLERLLRELQAGPPASRIRQVHAEWAPARGIHGFEIRRI